VIRRSTGGGTDSTDFPAPEASTLGGTDRGVAPAVLVAAHVLLAVLVFDPTLFPGADAGHYMVLGESLRNGMGFRDIHLPGSPLHAKFPPGYPLILAVASWIGGLQLFKAASLVFAAGSVWLTYRIARSLLGRRVAFVAAGLFAMAPVLLDFSHRVLSEAAFTFLLLLVVAATLGDRRVGAAALAAAGAAFFTRTAGLSVLLTLVVWTLLSSDGRRFLAAVTVASICVVGWAVYQHLAQPTQPGYLQQLIQENPYVPEAGTVSLVDFPARAATNLWRYVSSELPGSFGFRTVRRETVAGTAVVGIVLSSLALFGWLRSAVRQFSVAHLVVAFYVGLILLWPPVWTDRRFLLPILSLLVIFGAVGTVDALERVGPRVGYATMGLVAAGVATVALIASGSIVPYRVECQFSYRNGYPCDRPQYREFYAMGWWASENTPVGSVIANRSPATFYLFSRRQGDLYVYSQDPSIVIRGLEEMGADYVLVDRLSATTAMYLIPAIAANLERFEVVHTVGGEEGTALLRMLSAPRTASLHGRP
jgi:hypothetical protein